MKQTPQMGSWLSSAVHAVGGWVAGDGNDPGNSATRDLGYDPANVGPAVAAILSQPAGANVQSEVVVLGVAGLGLILLLNGRGRRR